MSIGHDIIDTIIKGGLCTATCAEHDEHSCVIVWSSGAAEQIEAMFADLERANAALQAQLAKALDCDPGDMVYLATLREQNAKLVAENAKLKGWHANDIEVNREATAERDEARRACNEEITRRNALVAENAGLREDKARLDWLDATTPHIFWSAVCNHPMNPEGECAVATDTNEVFYRKTYRESIDAARTARPKSHPEGDA